MRLFNTLWIILFFVSLGLNACEKENDRNGDSIPAKKPLIAGVSEPTGYLISFSPSIKLDENESGCLLYTGMDSIDMDKDGKSDFEFNSLTQSPDLTGICDDCPDEPDVICDYWPTGRIYKFLNVIDSSFQVACDNQYLTCLHYGDTIKSSQNWKNGKFLTLLDNYNFPPPESIYGNWTTEDDNYLGVRKIGTDTIYGWIKLNVSETIEIKESYFDGIE